MIRAICVAAKLEYPSMLPANPRTICALTVLFTSAVLVVGCGTTMGSDDSGRVMSTGISETRSGVSQTQTGVNKVNSGDRSSGVADIGSGIDMMNRGIADMHSGMNMMSSGMMANCMDGGAAGMMDGLQQAMDEIRAGQMMLNADASDGTAVGVSRMQNGITMMTGALDEAQRSVGCMGHSNMMAGGMI